MCTEFQKELTLSDIKTVPDNGTAPLSFCVTDIRTIVFVVTNPVTTSSLWLLLSDKPMDRKKKLVASILPIGRAFQLVAETESSD